MSVPENTKHLIILLNDLARINNDRVVGYKKAEEQAAGNMDLSSLFREKWQQSLGFIADLEYQIKRLDGIYNDDTSFAGKIFRTWMSIKNTIKQNDMVSILDSCKFGEDAAIKAYSDALRSDLEISAEVRQQILEQQTAIKKSYDLIKKYRDLNLNLFNYERSFT